MQSRPACDASRGKSAGSSAWSTWTHCVDILTQIAATTKALESVALLLLDEHLQHCLTHAEGPDDTRRKLTEASEAIARLVRS